MDCQVEKSVKLQRVAELSAVADKIRNDFLNEQIGKTLSVLVEEKQKDDVFFGYTANYTPVKMNDGVVGEIKEVKIDSVQDAFCIAE
jgi:threonylcarbamoyladenosine tRNA methylthiotransferase MtaB